ncbi:anaphase-promoting complex subunit 4 [Limosa lapponica baueri]|uniref:Anaphase-promoting complex subunit 4 n=1 Tax=Limosa lapponica baueri TaxID=1758121 RepID=A0A2I0THC7_LIMLA|nr:anaphase-promoting complex subunit 4 [Limosa lapponica baueri]
MGLHRLNALVLGGSSGFIEIYAYGMFKIAAVTGVAGSCRGLCLSSDLKSLSVITEIRDSSDSEAEITFFQLDTSLLSSYLPEVTRMARKFTHISTLLQYIKLSLTCMCEAWEEILMQMDSRLTKFVQEKNTTTSVQDEFMQLLLWGKASLELQALLMNQLTVKGLKKLGQSIESSYSSIQKLVISHLQSGSEALLYHLSELKGMALWKQKYESLGLDASGIEEAITAVGSFILKANELLQVIDSSMKNFKAFFRWLYVAMLRMSEDHVLPELNKYLKDEDDDLVSPPNTEGNQWFNFLKNSTHLKENSISKIHILRRHTDTSRLDEQSGEIPTRAVVLENQWRVLENMKAQYVAVNGIRKVSCVLSSNLRHVRVFEMDVEDDGEAEEEEEEETTQIAAGEPDELNQSADNQDNVCDAAAEELPDEAEEQESSLEP